jgi:hypothetical protein
MNLRTLLRRTDPVILRRLEAIRAQHSAPVVARSPVRLHIHCCPGCGLWFRCEVES